MVDETQETVDEKPSTHKKKAQTVAIVLVALLLLATAYSMVQKNRNKSSLIGNNEKIEKQEKATVGIETTPRSSSEKSVDLFNTKLNAKSQALKNSRKTDTIESPTQTYKRLLEQKNESLATQKRNAERGVVEEQFVVEKTPEQLFREEERLRALRSLTKGYGLKRQKTTAQNGSRNSLATKQQNISQRQSAIQKELARVRGIKAKLASGDINSQQASNMLGGVSGGQGGVSPAANSNAGFFGSAPTPTTNIAPRVIGRPASMAPPSQGQKLLPTGTVIRTVLAQNLNSDHMGTWKGLTVDDTYDVTGEYILIPKGTDLMGKTLVTGGGPNAAINSRMGLTTNWAILQDGRRISFEKTGLLDKSGVGAVEGDVDNHVLAQFLGVAAYALISSESSYAGSGADNDDSYSGEVGSGLREQFAPMAQKYLALIPTITLGYGEPMRVIIEDDMYITPYRETYAEFTSSSK